ncbi:MAG TPA: hypothetical protein VFN75_03140, partial [Pseudonocardiaceae bacterium]|nr:hypothetical protein [Pseudonocardiaceae bacterium]
LAAAPDQDPVRRYALFVLGDVALYEGHLDEAVRRYDQAAHFARAAGDSYTHAFAVVNAALPLAYRSDDVDAVAAARKARSVAVMTNSPYVVGWADYTLGEALSDVDPDQAIIAIDAALSAALSTRNRFLQGIALVSAASLRTRHDDPHVALGLFGQVIDHWQRAGNWTQQWITLRNVTCLLARLGADESAAILCGALDGRRTAAPLFGADADRLASTSAELCARLGERRHRDLLARGAEMTDDDAVMFVAAEIDRAARRHSR